MNSTTLNDFEIMAPVGSRESLAAAIQAGADSIYFGIENLNMRARSANTFTIDDLRVISLIYKVLLYFAVCCDCFQGWKMGLEPTTFGTTIRRSNRLSYIHHFVFVLAKIRRICYSANKISKKNV